MGISLPVGSHLDASQARRTARQAEDYFSTAGRDAGNAFSRQVNQGLGRVDTGKSRAQAAALQRAYDRAADAAGKLRAEEAKLEAVEASGTATRAQMITHTERLAKARRDEARAVRDAANAVRGIDNAGRSAQSAATSFSQMGQAASGMMSAMGSFAMAGAPAAILGVGSAAVTAAGALGVLPAAISGVAAGIGTLVIGMNGFGDAIKDMGDTKKFAQDLQKLSPSAQQAALQIKQLVDGPLGELRKATQEALFSGMAKELHDVTATLLPSVQAATTGIAGAFNTMGKGALDQLMTPETSAALTSTLTNVTTAFQNLAPAAAPFTKAIADVMAVGSSFLPGLATSVTNAANAFSQFITHAKDTGQLAKWISDGGDMLGQLGRLAVDAGSAFMSILNAGREVFPYVSGALHDVSDLLRDHPGLIWGVVGAFAAWKAIEGTAALITSLSTISAALTALPAVAATAAAGISAALASIAIPAVLAWLVGKGRDNYDDQHFPGLRDAVHNGGNVNDILKGVNGFDGGGGTFDNSGQISPELNIGPLADIPTIGLPPGYNPMQVTQGLPDWSPIAVPDAPGEGGKGKKNPLPTVPYGNQDPMSLLGGLPVTASLYSAAGTLLDSQQRVAQAQSDLNTLLKSNTATEDEIQKKRNDLARAQREEHESELRLTEAKQQATNKSAKALKSSADAMGGLGNQLDKDFGISKGLGGIVENLVKAVGNALTAPFLTALGIVDKANPNEGSGLIGIAAANGAFGPQYTPAAIAAANPTSSLTSLAGAADSAAAALGGIGGGRGAIGTAKPGESARDFAHRVMMPYFQQQGLSVGDHAADQYGEHQNGALDIMVPNIATGNQVLSQVLSDPNVYGAIFNNQTYGYGHGLTPQDYTAGHTGDPNQDHLNHVHALYKPGGTNNIVPSGPTMPTYSAAVGPDASGGYGAAPGTGLPAAGPGGGSMLPGMGAPNGLMANLAANQASGMGAGAAYPGSGGNSGNLFGGLGLDAAMAATSGLDMMMPGAGAAAKIGIQVANRSIGYAAQNAGILANGIMETLSVGDNPKGGLGNSWLGKIAGGFAGAAPALPNMAGAKAPQQQAANGQGGQGGNTYGDTNISVTAREGASGQEHADQIAAEMGRAYTIPGRQ